MNTYRVTLKAFGTSGVLLAASVAMLATVSAFVAFDGWPRGYGSGSVDSISVTGNAGSSALVVSGAAKPMGAGITGARAAAPAGFVKAAGPTAPGAATGGFAAGFVKTVPGSRFSFGPTQFAPGPSPWVPTSPYGEGGPGTRSGPSSDPNPIPRPVRDAVCGAGSSVCGVTQVGSSLGQSAPVSPPPAEVPQVQAPVQVQAPAPAQVPGPVLGG